MEWERPPGRAKRPFTKEFKADAVALVLGGDRPTAHVALDSGHRGDKFAELGPLGPQRPRGEAGVDD